MDVLNELDRAGAVLLDRHFVYKSGKHGSGYINMDTLFPRIHVLTEICWMLWQPFSDDTTVYFDTVASPAVVGVALSIAVAISASGFPRDVSPVWADKVGDDFRFERAGFVEHLAGKRVLVVEDLLTTGGSVIKVCREAERNGAEIIGVSVICNRGGVTAEKLGVPRLESLAEVSFDAVDPDSCAQCENWVSIVEDIGHGAAYKEAHPDYKGGYIKLL